MGSQHSRVERSEEAQGKHPDQSHPVDGGWCSEGFLHRQGWMPGETNFFEANCWPSSENMKVEINTKYPYQLQQASAVLVARGIQDGEGRQQESQAPRSSSLPPHRRPHHHQDPGEQVASPADVSPGCPGVHGGLVLEHLGTGAIGRPPHPTSAL